MHEMPTSDALELIGRLAGDDSELGALVREEGANAQLAREVYEIRTSRGLSQEELADLAGTRQSVIARLEDADYEVHSLRVLRRVAKALGARLDIRLVPREGPSA